MPRNNNTLIALALISALAFAPTPAFAQGFAEMGGLNASMAGMGAGAAAAAHAQLSHARAGVALPSITVQNKNVEQLFKVGNQFELQKQWQQAEKTFTAMLKAINIRDGSGSPKSVPALKHLAAISDAQNNVDQAISYQKTVLAFTKAGKTPPRDAVVQESLTLSELFIKKADFTAAEPLARESVALAKQPPVVPAERRRTLIVLGRICKALNKTDEAQEVERELGKEELEQSPESPLNMSGAAPAKSAPTTTIGSTKSSPQIPNQVKALTTTEKVSVPVPAAINIKAISSPKIPVTSEIKIESVPTTPVTSEIKIETTPAAPVSSDIKIEVAPPAPVTSEIKIEATPAAPATSEVKVESAPAAPVTVAPVAVPEPAQLPAIPPASPEALTPAPAEVSPSAPPTVPDSNRDSTAPK